MDFSEISTPKLVQPASERWYRYYAGFSSKFVNDVLDVINPKKGSQVLDPWMGAGTTPSVGIRQGMQCVGLDLNPVMIVTAKGQLIAEDTFSSIGPLIEEISRSPLDSSTGNSKLLGRWFDESTKGSIDSLACRIDELLIGNHHDPSVKVNEMSSLASFFYVCLFELTAMSLAQYRSSNPTWIRSGENTEPLISIDGATLSSKFRAIAIRKLNILTKLGRIPAELRNKTAIISADSRDLPLPDNYFDATVTSPPYLTRLDYVVAHLPELGVLGFDKDFTDGLRKQMIGTPKIVRNGSDRGLPIGTAAESLLRAVQNHESRASASYYGPVFQQYFDGMSQSMAEITRVSKQSSSMCMVVQDSWYKDIHVDLASAVASTAQQFGWIEMARKDFQNIRSLSMINPKVNPLARRRKPVESAILFRRH